MTIQSMIRNVSLALLAALALAGCGGDFDAEPAQQGSGVESLIVNNEVEVFPGDSVVDPQGDARIRVRHVGGGDRKFVTLLSGSADVVRSDSHGG